MRRTLARLINVAASSASAASAEASTSAAAAQTLPNSRTFIPAAQPRLPSPSVKGKERATEDPQPDIEEEERPKDLPPLQRLISSESAKPPPPSASEALLSLSLPPSINGFAQNDGSTTTLPHANHPFHTYNFVNLLQSNGFNKGSAEAIMRVTKSLLMIEENRAANELVAKGEMENEAYLFRAALDELRTEVQVQARNDAMALRSQTGSLQRDIDAFNQKLREDMQSVRHAIQIDFNSHKEEALTDQKNLTLKIIDLDNKYTVALADVRAELEAHKWEQTRRIILMIGTLLFAVVVTNSLDAANAPPPIPPPQPTVPTAADLGIQPAASYLSGKRVGEEEE